VPCANHVPYALRLFAKFDDLSVAPEAHLVSTFDHRKLNIRADFKHFIALTPYWRNVKSSGGD